MTFLRRVLKVQAALWALLGILLVLKPVIVVERLLQMAPATETPLLRILGVTSLVLAMLMVLVSQHAAQNWWWAWSFALLEAGVATVCVLHALLSAGEAAPTWSWWIAGVASMAFAALDLIGLARAGQEKPIV